MRGQPRIITGRRKHQNTQLARGRQCTLLLIHCRFREGVIHLGRDSIFTNLIDDTGRARQHTPQIAQWLTQGDPFLPTRISRIVRSWLPLRFLMTDSAFFTSPRVIARQDYRVRKVGEIDDRLHGPDQPLLRQHHDGDYALLIEKGQQLVQLQRQVALRGHGVEVSIDAVDHDHAHVIVHDRLADTMH